MTSTPKFVAFMIGTGAALACNVDAGSRSPVVIA